MEGEEQQQQPLLSEELLHTCRQLHQMVFSGNSPIWKEISEILILVFLCSPAISTRHAAAHCPHVCRASSSSSLLFLSLCNKVPGSWLETLKVLFHTSRWKHKTLDSDFLILPCTSADLITLPSPFKALLSYQVLTSYVFHWLGFIFI